jgi:hypothetical protein
MKKRRNHTPYHENLIFPCNWQQPSAGDENTFISILQHLNSGTINMQVMALGLSTQTPISSLTIFVSRSVEQIRKQSRGRISPKPGKSSDGCSNTLIIKTADKHPSTLETPLNQTEGTSSSHSSSQANQAAPFPQPNPNPKTAS